MLYNPLLGLINYVDRQQIKSLQSVVVVINFVDQTIYYNLWRPEVVLMHLLQPLETENCTGGLINYCDLKSKISFINCVFGLKSVQSVCLINFVCAWTTFMQNQTDCNKICLINVCTSYINVVYVHSFTNFFCGDLTSYINSVNVHLLMYIRWSNHLWLFKLGLKKLCIFHGVQTNNLVVVWTPSTYVH